LVAFQATYEKGTDEEIAEFIYQTLDVNGNGSDLELVLVVIFKSVFSTKSSDVESSDYSEMVDSLLNAASFSKSDDASNKGMIVWIQIYPWHIGGALPHHELAEWKLLYHSSLHGQSFNTFLGHTSHTGMSASVLIIKDREGCLYGGYVSQPWERYSDFYRDMKSFLFQLNPNASIFRPTGANTDIQWNIPNGRGFGGKVHHFGLFISAGFDQGHSFSCTTFGSPSLSKTS
ncbi:hypothetical protein EUTSA_v10029204mg, partial [Eutrema salsugineum]